MYRSPFPDVAIPSTNLAVFLLSKISEHSNNNEHPVFIHGLTNTVMTYSDLVSQTYRCAKGLTELGLKRNEIVGVILPNCLEFPVVTLAVAGLCAQLATVNPMYTVDETHHQLEDCKAKYLFVHHSLLQNAVSASQGTNVEKIFTVGGSADGFVSFEELIDNEGISGFDIPEDFDAKTEVAALPYSSGTSGLPKGVMLTHYSLVGNLIQCCCNEEALFITPDDVLIAVLPFFHFYGLAVIMMGTIFSHSKAVVFPKFDPDLYLKSIEKHRVTHLFVAPPIVG